MREFLENLHPLFAGSLLLLFGTLGSLLARRLNLPSVTGYIVMGVLMGRSLLSLFPEWIIEEDFSLVTNFALGLIAFDIGSRLSLRVLKRLGKQVSLIALFETVGCLAIVAAAIVGFSVLFPEAMGMIPKDPLRVILPFALVLGATAAASAPATTLAVIQEYNVRGPVSNLLIATVALDNGLALGLFGVVFALSDIFLGGGDRVAVGWLLARPLLKILASIAVGGVVGLVFSQIRIERKRDQLIGALLAILFCSGLAFTVGFSPILTTMAAGCALINLRPEGRALVDAVKDFEPPILVAFFTIAGVHLDIRLLFSVGILGIAYLGARTLGKITGAWLGGVVAGSSSAVKRYLGWGLVSQAGLSIGLVILVVQSPLFGKLGEVANNIVLGGVAVNELVGPVLARWAFKKAGEIGP